MKIKTLFASILIVLLVTPLWARGPNGPSASSQLAEAEKANILYLYEEEKLARDIYFEMYNAYGAYIFNNISESEQRHMDAIKRLIDIYGLEDSITNDAVGQFDDPAFTALYEQFVADGTDLLLDALNVGVSIEELDIADLDEALEQTTMRNVRRVFENLRRGSTNHLAAFQQCIETCETECLQTGACDGTCLQNQDRDFSCQNL